MEHIVQALTRLIGSAMAVGGSLCWSKTTTTIAVRTQIHDAVFKKMENS